MNKEEKGWPDRTRTPIAGVATTPSEKQDKRLYNRRYRRAVRQAVHYGDEARPLPVLHEYSNPWLMGKDGKRRFDAHVESALLCK